MGAAGGVVGGGGSGDGSVVEGEALESLGSFSGVLRSGDGFMEGELAARSSATVILVASLVVVVLGVSVRVT